MPSTRPRALTSPCRQCNPGIFVRRPRPRLRSPPLPQQVCGCDLSRVQYDPGDRDRRHRLWYADGDGDAFSWQRYRQSAQTNPNPEQCGRRPHLHTRRCSAGSIPSTRTIAVRDSRHHPEHLFDNHLLLRGRRQGHFHNRPGNPDHHPRCAGDEQSMPELHQFDQRSGFA